jgi:hypothetical protein
LNYFLMPASDDWINVGGRFFTIARNVQAFYNKIKQKTSEQSFLTQKEVTILGEEDIPFVIWQLHVRYKLKGFKKEIPLSYCFFDQKQKTWNDRSVTGEEMIFEDDSGNQKIVRICSVPLPIVIRNDPSQHFWSCRDRVILLEDLSKIQPIIY